MIAVANLVKKNVALGDCARDHHGGQTRHGHLMNAFGKILRLINGDFLLLQRGPMDQADP